MDVRTAMVAVAAVGLACGPTVAGQPFGDDTGSGTGSGTTQSSSGGTAATPSVTGSAAGTSGASGPGTESGPGDTSSSGAPACPCGPPSLELIWEAESGRGFSSGFSDFGTSTTPGGHVWALRQPLPVREVRPLQLLHSSPGGELDVTNLPDLIDLEAQDVLRLAASDSGLAVAAASSSGATDLHLFTPDPTYACVVPTEFGFGALFGQEDGSWVLVNDTGVVRIDGCAGPQQTWPAIIDMQDSVQLARFDDAGLWLLGVREGPKNQSFWFVRRYETGQAEPSLVQEVQTFVLPSTHEAVAFDGMTAYFAATSLNGPPRVDVLHPESGLHQQHSVDPLADGLGPQTLDVVLEDGDAWLLFPFGPGLEAHPVGTDCCGASVQTSPEGDFHLRAARLYEGALIVEGGGSSFAPRRLALE